MLVLQIHPCAAWTQLSPPPSPAECNTSRPSGAANAAVDAVPSPFPGVRRAARGLGSSPAEQTATLWSFCRANIWELHLGSRRGSYGMSLCRYVLTCWPWSSTTATDVFNFLYSQKCRLAIWATRQFIGQVRGKVDPTALCVNTSLSLTHDEDNKGEVLFFFLLWRHQWCHQ